jgi:hypothetical protein
MNLGLSLFQFTDLIGPPLITFLEPCRNHLFKGFCFCCLRMCCAGNAFRCMVTEPIVQQRTFILVDSVTLGNVFSLPFNTGYKHYNINEN